VKSACFWVSNEAHLVISHSDSKKKSEKEFTIVHHYFGIAFYSILINFVVFITYPLSHQKMFSRSLLICTHATYGGRNPAPPWIFETLKHKGINMDKPRLSTGAGFRNHRFMMCLLVQILGSTGEFGSQTAGSTSWLLVMNGDGYDHVLLYTAVF
jgi:hypothetical protein